MNYIEPFQKSIINYFREISPDSTITISDPIIELYINETFEYSGVIGFSGDIRGSMYFSAEKKFFSQLISIILGSEVEDENLLLDMAGEITNTIAGNVESHFEETLNISAPVSLKGNLKSIQMRNLREPVYNMNLEWNGLKAITIIGLEKFEKDNT